MKKIILLACLLSFSAKIIAQTTEKDLLKKTEDAAKIIADTTGNGWSKKGTLTFLFNQASFSNWVAGGESSLSGTLGLNYEFHYKNAQTTWDNRILANYGLMQTKNADFEKKTDDRFEYNSIYGKKAFGEWYFSFILNFKTQFTCICSKCRSKPSLTDTSRTCKNQVMFGPNPFTISETL